MGFWFSAAFFQEFFTQQQLEILQNEITVASAEATGAFLGLWKVITVEKFDQFFLGLAKYFCPNKNLKKGWGVPEVSRHRGSRI